MIPRNGRTSFKTGYQSKCSTPKEAFHPLIMVMWHSDPAMSSTHPCWMCCEATQLCLYRCEELVRATLQSPPSADTIRSLDNISDIVRSFSVLEDFAGSRFMNSSC